LVGLAGVSKNLVGCMEKGTLPPRMTPATCNCSPPFAKIPLDTVTGGSIHGDAWTAQPFSPFPAMT
jgi:hypothetical protein